ncbi:hypothetical protein T492DRAFT_1040280 [Pavlovales sp. CCMP2436]|nr:hypothetical protein T492DRAFT_1040280 [Pavlovales sp. CCMP2436]
MVTSGSSPRSRPSTPGLAHLEDTLDARSLGSSWLSKSMSKPDPSLFDIDNEALRVAAAAYATGLRLRAAREAQAREAQQQPQQQPAPSANMGAGGGDEGYDAHARRTAGCAGERGGAGAGATLERLAKLAQAVQLNREHRDSAPAPPPPGPYSPRASASAGFTARHGGSGGARAKSPSTVVDRLESWASDRAARLEASVEDSHRHAHAPQLDANSLELVARMRGRTGPIEEQLIAEAARKRADFNAQAAAQLEHTLASARPAISARARALERGGDVAERLTAYAELYAQRRAQLALRLEAEQKAHSVHLRAEGGTGSARVNESSAYASVRLSSAHLVERLAATPTSSSIGGRGGRLSGAASLGSFEPFAHSHNVEHTFAPCIDEHSRALAEALGESASERLLKPSMQALRRAAEAEREAMAAAGDEEAMLALLQSHELRQLRECSFAPKVHAASAKLAGAKRAALAHAAAALTGRPVSAGPRFETLHLEAKTREAMHCKLVKDFERREAAGCTFAPETLENGKMRAESAGKGKGTGGRRLRRASAADASSFDTPARSPARSASQLGMGYTKSGTDSEVLHRLSTWAKRKEQRIELKREELTQRSMADCTFAPHLEAASSLGEEGRRESLGGSRLESASEPLSLRSAVSVSKFLQRQADGRARQAQRTDVPHVTGEGWTRAGTTPAEFQFATDGPAREAKREAIRAALCALHPPVSCSVGEAACQASRLDRPSDVGAGAGLGPASAAAGSFVQLAMRSPRGTR